MADKDKAGKRDSVDVQMERLTMGLREQGVAPARDLWPEIDGAIAAAEHQQLRAAPLRRNIWPRLLATAAVVTLLLTAGWWGLQQPSGGTSAGGSLVASIEPGNSEVSDMDVIELALTEVNLALAADPGNRSLTNLVLMLHQSRGRMMRQNTDLQLYGG